jgi:hypothetical protein
MATTQEQLQKELRQKQRQALEMGASVDDATLLGKIPLFAENRGFVQQKSPQAQGGLLQSLLPQGNVQRFVDNVMPSNAPTAEDLRSAFTLSTGVPTNFSTQGMDFSTPGGAGAGIRGLLGQAAADVAGQVSDIASPVKEFGSALIFGDSGLTDEERAVQPSEERVPGVNKLKQIAEQQKREARDANRPDPMQSLREVVPKEEHSWLNALDKEFDLTTVGLALMATAGNGDNFGANLGRALMAGKKNIALQAEQKEKAVDRKLARSKVISEINKNLTQAQKNAADALGVGNPDSIKVTGEDRTQARLEILGLYPELKETAASDALANKLARTFKMLRADTPDQRAAVTRSILQSSAGGEQVVNDPWLRSPRISNEALPNMNINELLRMQQLKAMQQGQ